MFSDVLSKIRLDVHMPIFEVLETEQPKSLEQQKTYKLFEFSNSNVNKFIETPNRQHRMLDTIC